MMAGKFEELKILNESGELANMIWHEVTLWSDFARDTVGKQLVRAVDSISANFAEAYGRYHYGEKIQFLYYARGSLFESKNWINRCVNRSLISETKAETYAASLTNVAKQLNGFLRYLQRRRSQNATKSVRESPAIYETNKLDPSYLFSEAELNWLAALQKQTL